ncbi:MAG: hypothetical protein IJC61_04930 [Oscillospiraceae bacterium]|nr:hypothetical protein [Oscillospiraceae bacterium]
MAELLLHFSCGRMPKTPIQTLCIPKGRPQAEGILCHNSSQAKKFSALLQLCGRTVQPFWAALRLGACFGMQLPQSFFVLLQDKERRGDKT